jgi:glycerol kinase
MTYLCSLDQSTTSTKFTLFQTNGKLIAQDIIEHQQYTPSQGLLEHDPIEIIKNVQATIANVLAKAKELIPNFSVEDIKGVGITNQR